MQQELFKTKDKDSGKGALFSQCKQYRFVLWRIWSISKPLVMFIGLNPSTANGTDDDATIRKVVGFAKRWKYGGVYMLNCFPYISTDPKKLHDFGNTKENDELIELLAKKCEMIVFAWGNFEVAKQRGEELAKLFPQAKCLAKNKNGSPKHPLYVPYEIEPVLYQDEK